MNDNEHKLGLPLEYQKMPEYFDAHNINEETETKNALIEKLLRKQNVKSVLDMTCGTGSQVFYLAKRGYDVVGSDFSPSLLAIVRIPEDLITDSGRHLITDSGVFDHFNDSRCGLSFKGV
nr:class I SAM-dependent methyltransferase [Legionella pneumophila]